MNKHNAKDYLPLVQALAEGKEIEFYEYLEEPPNWSPLKNPDFTCAPRYYRIKPALVITPGKWRMRNGEVKDIIPHIPFSDPRFKFQSVEGLFYMENGRLFDNRESEFDLISKVETRWRPWRPEEVPLGREIRSKRNHSLRCLIVHNHTPESLFETRELLQPDGTYVPCGVEEELGTESATSK